MAIGLVLVASAAAWWWSFSTDHRPRAAVRWVSPAAPSNPTWMNGPIRVTAVEGKCEDGPVRGLVALVDLADPRVQVVVTGPIEGPATEGTEARLLPTDTWIAQTGCTLALNGNYFGRLPEDDTLLSRTRPWTEGEEVDILGLSVSDGRVVSPARLWENQPDPCVVFDSDGRARIGFFTGITRDDQVAVRQGLSGFGRTDEEPRTGTMLVEKGVNTGKTAKTQPLRRHPRTAAGVSADGRTLILATIDGRQPEHSVGLTLPELAQLMIAHGAFDAVNLDGGGSTSLIFEAAGSERVTNKPSEGKFRAVANHLGIRLIEPAGRLRAPGE